MNRTIKFRVWDGIRYHYSDLIIPRLINSEGPNEYLLFKKEYVYQQFTGLFDKNDKEIYEGDIVEVFSKDVKFIGQVSFNAKAASYEFRTKANIPIYRHSLYLFEEIQESGEYKGINTSYFEVVGNVFENPELLT